MSMFSSTRLLHVVLNYLPKHSFQRLIFTGIITSFLYDFFHDLGNIADIFLTSNISNYLKRSRSLLLSLNPINVICC